MDAGEQTNKGQDQDSGSPLWRFAIALYARPGVAEACLEAQDQRGVDVNLLLCACWCAYEGQSLSPSDFLRAQARCEAWRDAVILPLRKQRQGWQGVLAKREEYAAIKSLELHAERTQLDFLATLFAQGMPPARPSEEQGLILRDANLCALAQHYALDSEAFSRFSAAALSC